MSFLKIPETGTGTQQPNRRVAMTVRRSASIKVVAGTMAWSMITAAELSQAGGIHTVTLFDEQREPHDGEIARAYSVFEAAGAVEGPAKDMLKVQQSDPLTDVKIAAQVKEAVRRDPDVRTVDVVVFVSDRVVILSGTVSTHHQKARAEQLASEVESVTEVVNHIAVAKVRRWEGHGDPPR